MLPSPMGSWASSLPEASILNRCPAPLLLSKTPLAGMLTSTEETQKSSPIFTIPWQWKVLKETLISLTRFQVVVLWIDFSRRLKGLSSGRGADLSPGAAWVAALEVVSAGDADLSWNAAGDAARSKRPLFKNFLLSDIVCFLVAQSHWVSVCQQGAFYYENII